MPMAPHIVPILDQGELREVFPSQTSFSSFWSCFLSTQTFLAAMRYLSSTLHRILKS
jgi:hypothetical protein